MYGCTDGIFTLTNEEGYPLSEPIAEDVSKTFTHSFKASSTGKVRAIGVCLSPELTKYEEHITIR